MSGVGFSVQGVGFRVQGSGCRVQRQGSWDYPGNSGDDDDDSGIIGGLVICVRHVHVVDPHLALPGRGRGLYNCIPRVWGLKKFEDWV